MALKADWNGIDASPSRRRVLRTSVAGAAAMWSGRPALTAAPTLSTPIADAGSAGRPLRFAYLTDPHVYPNVRVEKGMPRMFDRLTAIDPAPAFVVTGGDHVNDALATTRSDAEQQWKLYLRLMRDGCDLPKFAVIGNHDIYGWGNPNVSSTDRDYGKAMALDHLGMDRSYYSFDAGGWHFIVLDNIGRREHAYFADLNSRQLEWLTQDLSGIDANTPICLFTHIPLLSACALFDTGSSQRDGYRVCDSSMQARVGDVLALFSSARATPRNLRLCISGHLHMVDRVDYRGITFHCGGAICGNWWQGPYQGHPPGFGIFDLWPDGRTAQEFVAY